MRKWYANVVSAKGCSELIGKPITTGFPYSLVSSLNIEKLGGYATCGSNSTKWAAHAGDPNYNLINECCKAMNSGGNPGALGTPKSAEKYGLHDRRGTWA